MSHVSRVPMTTKLNNVFQEFHVFVSELIRSCFLFWGGGGPLRFLFAMMGLEKDFRPPRAEPRGSGLSLAPVL